MEDICGIMRWEDIRRSNIHVEGPMNLIERLVEIMGKGQFRPRDRGTW